MVIMFAPCPAAPEALPPLAPAAATPPARAAELRRGIATWVPTDTATFIAMIVETATFAAAPASDPFLYGFWHPCSVGTYELSHMHLPLDELRNTTLLTISDPESELLLTQREFGGHVHELWKSLLVPSIRPTVPFGQEMQGPAPGRGL